MLTISDDTSQNSEKLLQTVFVLLKTPEYIEILEQFSPEFLSIFSQPQKLDLNKISDSIDKEEWK